MALQKQKITIPLAQGVDTKTDPKLTTGNIEVTNAYQPYTGELRKRRGMSALSTAVVGAATNTVKNPRVCLESPQSNLLVAGHQFSTVPTAVPAIFSVDPTADVGAKSVSPYYPVRAEYQFACQTPGLTGLSYDIASLTYLGDEFICVATGTANAVPGTTVVASIYTAGGQIHSESTTLRAEAVGAAASQVHLYALTTTTLGVPVFLAIYESDGAIYISYWRPDTNAWTGPTSLAAGLPITVHGATVGEFWDTCAVTVGGYDQVLIAYRNTGTTNLEFARINESGVVGSSTVATATVVHATARIGCNYVYRRDISAYCVAVAYNTAAANTIGWGTLAADLATWSGVLGTLAPTSTSGTGEITVGYEDPYQYNVNAAVVIFIQFSTATVTNNVVQITATFNTGAMAAVQYLPATRLSSKPWRNLESAAPDYTQHIMYSPAAAIGDSLQFGYSLCLVSSVAKAHAHCQMLYGLAPYGLSGNIGKTHVPQVGSTGTRYLALWTCRPEIEPISTLATQFSAKIFKVDFEAASTYASKARESNAAYLAAGHPSGVYTSAVVENGFGYTPEIISYANVGGAGGGLAATTYYFSVVYEYRDSNGERHISTPSLEYSQACNLNDLLRIVVTPYNLGSRDKADSGQVLVYASNAATGPRYLQPTGVSAVGIGTNTPITINLMTYYTTGEQLYTTGGVLENYAAPSGNKLCISDGGRMFVVPFDEPCAVYHSKKKTAGFAYEFAGEYFKHEIQGNSRITGLASHGGYVFIFTKEGIYALYGDGPDDLGNNPFLPPQRISNVGAEERSILVTPQGVAFKRPQRGWAILAGNQVQPLPPVTFGWESQTVRACAYNQVENLWHYQLSTDHVVFDPEHQAWYKWEWAHAETPVDFCTTNGTLVQVTNTSLVLKQAAVYTDNSVNYGMTIQTAWVKLDGLAGFGRLYEVRLVGRDLSANSVRLDLYSDFGTSSDQNGTSTGSGAGQLACRLHVYKQKITAALVKIALASASTAGVAVTALELVYGVKARKPYSVAKSL